MIIREITYENTIPSSELEIILDRFNGLKFPCKMKFEFETINGAKYEKYGVFKEFNAYNYIETLDLFKIRLVCEEVLL